MTAPEPVGCTVVVVNFNGADYVLDCLKSLRGQTATDTQIEIVVVDNASTDGSDLQIDEHFPDVRLIRSKANLGFAGGVNLAVRSTAGELVVLVNNDATAEPGFLEAAIAPFRGRNGRLAAVTGRIVLTGRFVPARRGDPDAYVSASGERWTRVPEGSPQDAGVQLVNSTGSQVSRSGNARDRSWLSPVDLPPPPAEVFGFCGGAVAIRRQAFESVGGFDEGLFMYYEDVDLSWRLRRSGWDIRYAPDAVVQHRHAASSGVRSRLFLTHNIRNRVLVTARNAPPAMLRAALVRTVGNLGRTLLHSLSPTVGADARKQLSAAFWALRQLATRLPGYLADGRSRDRRSELPRDFVYPWAVDD